MRTLFFPLVVATAVAFSAGLSLRRVEHQVDDADLDRAATQVRESFVPGDLIIVDPPFMIGPRQRLGDLPLIEPKTLAPEDLLGVSRVHLLSLDVIGSELKLVAQLSVLGSREDEQVLGNVTYATFRMKAREHVVLDLRERVPQLEVTARYADGVVARCATWERDRWVCPRDPGWSYVGRETLDIDGQPRDCVWMHPIAKGGVLEIVLPTAQSTKEARLVSGLGFAFESRRRVKAPVHVEISTGQQRLVSVDHAPALGWQRLEAPLMLSGEPLRIEVTTADNGAAHFCMALKILEALP